MADCDLIEADCRKGKRVVDAVAMFRHIADEASSSSLARGGPRGETRDGLVGIPPWRGVIPGTCVSIWGFMEMDVSPRILLRWHVSGCWAARVNHGTEMSQHRLNYQLLSHRRGSATSEESCHVAWLSRRESCREWENFI